MLILTMLFVEKYEAKDVDALLHKITDSVTVRMETNPDRKRLQEDLFCDSGCICCKLQKQVIPGISGLCQHKELVTNQYAMVHDIKGNLNEETCTVQMDFAEMFLFQPMVKKSSLLTSTKHPSHYFQL